MSQWCSFSFLTVQFRAWFIGFIAGCPPFLSTVSQSLLIDSCSFTRMFGRFLSCARFRLLFILASFASRLFTCAGFRLIWQSGPASPWFSACVTSVSLLAREAQHFSSESPLFSACSLTSPCAALRCNFLFSHSFVWFFRSLNCSVR